MSRVPAITLLTVALVVAGCASDLLSPHEWNDASNFADTDHDGVVSQTEFEAAGGSWGGGDRGGGR